MLFSALSAKMLPFAEAREAVQRDSALTNKIDELRDRENTGARAVAAALETLRFRSTQPQALDKFAALQSAISARMARTNRTARVRGAVYMPASWL